MTRHIAGQYGPVLWAVSIAAWIPGWSVFHGIEESRAHCCQNTLSYSSQPRPGCIGNSLTGIRKLGRSGCI